MAWTPDLGLIINVLLAMEAEHSAVFEKLLREETVRNRPGGPGDRQPQPTNSLPAIQRPGRTPTPTPTPTTQRGR